MTIARHETRLQICCDHCPASYPNTYEADDFRVMIADAKTAGWKIAKAAPARHSRDTSDLFGAPPRIAGKASAEPEPYTHTCPDCAARHATEGRLF